MATLRPSTCRPLLRNAHHCYQSHTNTTTRAFLPGFPSPFAASSSDATPQTLIATRILPYPSPPIYSIIADVSSYASFLPYCHTSTVTRWSAPDATYQRRWPSEGRLTVGFANVTEDFTSKVYCVPGRVVESVGGATSTSIPEGEIPHHLEGATARQVDEGGEAGGLLTHLRSKWTIDAQANDQTQVTLALEFAFSNPLYTALSAGVAPQVADVMVKAFEERVRILLDNDARLRSARLEELDGSGLRMRH